MNRFIRLSCRLKTAYNPIVPKSTKYSFLKITNSVRYSQNYFCSDSIATTSKKSAVVFPETNEDLKDNEPVLLPSYNLAAYADESPLLQKLIELGVELYKFDENPKIGEYLLKLDFKKNIKPYLTFLHDNGVAPDNFGQFITKNPFIFKEDLNDLEVRINYLLSKKFDKQKISEILTKTPKWLSFPVIYVDKRLGYLQQTFKLKGDQVRQVITQCPDLIKVPDKDLRVNVFTIKEELDLDAHSLKKVLLAAPYLFKKSSSDILSTYDYLTKKMQVSQQLIVQQPIVLTTRRFILKERHGYLVSLGRAQYNPLLPGYVSLLDLVQTTDVVFCEKIAKTSVLSYNDFLKTL